MVANFQEHNIFYMHYLGAFLAFGFWPYLYMDSNNVWLFYEAEFS